MPASNNGNSNNSSSGSNGNMATEISLENLSSNDLNGRRPYTSMIAVNGNMGLGPSGGTVHGSHGTCKRVALSEGRQSKANGVGAGKDRD